MPVADLDLPADLAPTAPLPRRAFALAWGVFWLLMLLVAVQEEWRGGDPALWRPLLWEGTSCLLATGMVVLLWRRVVSFDRLLDTPWRWFAAQLVWLPLVAPIFVALLYGLRHALFVLVGQTYQHEPWAQVFGYECAKFAVFYGLFAAIFFGMRSYALMVSERLRAERAAAQAKQAQLLQLAQQIEPHFLFNAIGTITETIHSDPQLADSLLTRLAALLRAATDLTRKPETRLADELRLLESYAAIMRERFADRVAVHFDIDTSLNDQRVPTLLMQPLLENAFRHGVERRAGAATIRVLAQQQGQGMLLAVEDDIGVLDGVPVFGTGLSNLRERLATRYGAQASLEVEARPGGGVRSVVTLPLLPGLPVSARAA